MSSPKVGDLINDKLLVMKVYEWDNYYDLDVVNRETDESGHIRIDKVLTNNILRQHPLQKECCSL